MTSVISCKQLSKSFLDAHKRLVVLKDIAFEVEEKKTVAILGASGVGKSTFLQLLGGLDKPTSGKVFWGEHDIHHLSEKKRSRLRNQYLGFVYQFHHLMPEFTALENVAMPLLIGSTDIQEASDRAAEFLKKVGLPDKSHRKLSELSGGERQRLAVARALVTRPRCVLADEPTGNLDAKTALQVLDVMLELQAELKTSIVIVTHDLQLAKRMHRCYEMQSGGLEPLHT
ncbi:MAG: ATP-binding cassette domain-containing protein [Pseudomonadota bacterium]|nr:ATP-binding cassette domain-containing protein [Gammaproteobacteria bacterium]MBU2546308.1 ATP-binding cassette domain-containing protein [Gammaproteobacteria bacterium]